MDPLNPEETQDFIAPQRKARDRPTPFSSLVEIDVGGLSHVGKVRRNNEDHFFIGRFGRFLETIQTNLPADAVLHRSEEGGYGMAVADGMGGSAAGAEASRLAISSLINLVLHTPDWILRLDEEQFPEEVKRRAAERFEQVNQRMTEAALETPGLSGFGTTMTMACSVGKDLFIAHVGDSRAYLFSRGRLQQLTKDHTLAQALVDGKMISRNEAATHRLRHVLTQALGDTGHDVDPEVQQTTLDHQDVLLLCTDGLTELVDDKVIGELLGSGAEAQTICQYLVDRALVAGGHDNITVVIARYLFP